VFDGWLVGSFTPSYANAHLDFISRGAEAHGRSLDDIDIQAGGTVAVEADMAGVMGSLKTGMAFTLGAMGSAKTNFYNDAYKRGGWEDAANEVQGLWVAGRREEAIAKVPEEMVLQSNLVGVRKTKANNSGEHRQVKSVRQLDFCFILHSLRRLSIEVVY
jgi:alkanesulfonate monooxygenase SsuD/methylene tetrahydromethanopterin reductase-like flavin-dependent oxidoreductase (luciferase family)